MSGWWSYRLSDFLLFSAQTYYRLFELYNQAVWPMQLVTLALGAGVFALVLRNPPWQGRAIAAVLAAAWLWVAWAYHLQRYEAINWAASHYAAGFAVQALLFIWTGVIRNRLVFRLGVSMTTRAGLGIFLFALVVYPLIAPILGRNWMHAEVFGIAPDPTVVATLGLLLLAANRACSGLMLIPLLWCAISGATLWAMGSPDAFIAPVAGFLVVVLVRWKTYRLAKNRPG